MLPGEKQPGSTTVSPRFTVQVGACLMDLKALMLRSGECWRNLRITASLAPHSAPQPLVPWYMASFRYDYHVMHCAPVLRFACVSDEAEYRRLQTDPGMTEVWYFQPKGDLDATSPDVFALTELTVNGRPHAIQRSIRAGGQYYTARLIDSAVSPMGDTDGELCELTISFTYRGLVQQYGHLLRVDLIKPTDGLTIALHYATTGIRRVSVVDYIASAARPMISQTPATAPSPSIAVTFDGWVLPKAGIVFVWALDSETIT